MKNIRLNVLKSLSRNIYISTEMEAQSKYKNKINEAFEDSKIRTLKIALRRTNS